MRSYIFAIQILGLCLGPLACSGEPAGAHPAAAHHAPAVSQVRHKVPLAADDHALKAAPSRSSRSSCSPTTPARHARAPGKVLEHLLEDYGDDLRVVFRSLTAPGFLDAERAAEAAFAAGAQGQFWAMHRRLFSEPRFDRASLKAHAEALGLDVPRFLDDLDLGAFSGPRAQHRRQAITLGIYFGPVALVNGRPVVGHRDEAAWHDLLDEEILAARARMQAGTPRADLYAAFQEDAAPGAIDLEPAQEEMRSQLAQRFAVDVNQLPADFVRAEPGRRYPVDLSGAPTQGPADAPVTLVVFMDFECPLLPPRRRGGVHRAAARFPNDLRIGFRHLPLPAHRSADGAARAAVAAERQAKVWAFSDRMLTLEKPTLGRDTFLEIARASASTRPASSPTSTDRTPPPASARTCSSPAGSASTARRRSSSTAATSAAFAMSTRSSPTSTPNSQPPRTCRPRAPRAPSSSPRCWLAKA
jgi:protein-disulfide isomerase